MFKCLLSLWTRNYSKMPLVVSTPMPINKRKPLLRQQNLKLLKQLINRVLNKIVMIVIFYCMHNKPRSVPIHLLHPSLLLLSLTTTTTTTITYANCWPNPLHNNNGFTAEKLGVGRWLCFPKWTQINWRLLLSCIWRPWLRVMEGESAVLGGNSGRWIIVFCCGNLFTPCM